MVITKSREGYVATFVFWGPGEKPASPRPTFPISMTRQGDTLVGRYKALNQNLRAKMVYEPSSGRATWTNSRTADGPFNKPTTMIKVSEGTAYPTTL